jgi:predicted TIM-barrel fold metal-dependent hydrolase
MANRRLLNSPAPLLSRFSGKKMNPLVSLSQDRSHAISAKAPLSNLLPKSSWDSHMHITDPERFSPSANATYKPHAALLPEALANAKKLSLPNLVLVQPSTYGTDNSCLLHYLSLLRKGDPNAARAVVVINPSRDARDAVSDDTLRAWHEQGVRGVRINLKSVGKSLDSHAMRELLGSYVERLNSVGGNVSGWAVQVFVNLAEVGTLKSFAQECLGSGKQGKDGGIKLVIDHMGSPSVIKKNLNDMPGWTELLDLMQNPGVFVKISGYYRTRGLDGKSPASVEEWEPAVQKLLETRAGDGVVFASDWPHTRFEGWDIDPWTRSCYDWAGTEELREKLFRGNARILWDV